MRTLPNTVPAGKHESPLLSTIVTRTGRAPPLPPCGGGPGKGGKAAERNARRGQGSAPPSSSRTVRREAASRDADATQDLWRESATHKRDQRLPRPSRGEGRVRGGRCRRPPPQCWPNPAEPYPSRHARRPQNPRPAPHRPLPRRGRAVERVLPRRPLRHALARPLPSMAAPPMWAWRWRSWRRENSPAPSISTCWRRSRCSSWKAAPRSASATSATR